MNYIDYNTTYSSEGWSLTFEKTDPINRRFTSPDILDQDPFNTQSYNRYAYCLNNPLKYTDPSGYVFQGYGDYIAHLQNIFSHRGSQNGYNNFTERGIEGYHYSPAEQSTAFEMLMFFFNSKASVVGGMGGGVDDKVEGDKAKIFGSMEEMFTFMHAQAYTSRKEIAGVIYRNNLTGDYECVVHPWSSNKYNKYNYDAETLKKYEEGYTVVALVHSHTSDLRFDRHMGPSEEDWKNSQAWKSTFPNVNHYIIEQNSYYVMDPNGTYNFTSEGDPTIPAYLWPY